LKVQADYVVGVKVAESFEERSQRLRNQVIFQAKQQVPIVERGLRYNFGAMNVIC